MMKNNLQKLVSLCFEVFEKQNSQYSLTDILSLMDKTDYSDLNLAHYLANLDHIYNWDCHEIFFSQNFHISLLVVPKGNYLPFHDHKDMFVLSKVLYGKMHFLSFDWAKEYPLSGLAYLRQDIIADQNSSSLILKPDSCNIHRIEALEDSIFLDIFSPWYNHERVCHYYKMHGQRVVDNKVLYQLAYMA